MKYIYFTNKNITMLKNSHVTYEYSNFSYQKKDKSIYIKLS